MSKQFESKTLAEWQEGGRTPILPFEEQLLRSRLNQLGVKQTQLGKLLGETMDQSSETWHDNHAAEMISQDSRGMTDEANHIIGTLRAARVVPYGGVEPIVPGIATLGNVVQVNFGDKEWVSMLLTGVSSSLPEELEAVNEGVEVLSIASPLGAAILDAEKGAVVSYEVNSRSLTASIGEIATFYA